jgi:hypothetical protein
MRVQAAKQQVVVVPGTTHAPDSPIVIKLPNNNIITRSSYKQSRYYKLHTQTKQIVSLFVASSKLLATTL